MKTKLLLFFLFWLSFHAIFAQEQKLNSYQVPQGEVTTYTKLREMLLNEGTDCLIEINSIEGWAIWGYKFAIKKGLYWMVFPQPEFNMNNSCDMEITKVFFQNLNSVGNEELILEFSSKEYGAKGGTDYQYLQVWDVDARLLILNLQTKEHFHWWSSDDDEGICETNVVLEKEKITLKPANCKGAVEGFLNVNDTTTQTFIWDGAWFAPQ